MRRQDKAKKIEKANLMMEQRRLNELGDRYDSMKYNSPDDYYGYGPEPEFSHVEYIELDWEGLPLEPLNRETVEALLDTTQIKYYDNQTCYYMNNLLGLMGGIKDTDVYINELITKLINLYKKGESYFENSDLEKLGLLEYIEELAAENLVDPYDCDGGE